MLCLRMTYYSHECEFIFIITYSYSHYFLTLALGLRAHLNGFYLYRLA